MRCLTSPRYNRCQVITDHCWSADVTAMNKRPLIFLRHIDSEQLRGCISCCSMLRSEASQLKTTRDAMNCRFKVRALHQVAVMDEPVRSRCESVAAFLHCSLELWLVNEESTQQKKCTAHSCDSGPHTGVQTHTNPFLCPGPRRTAVPAPIPCL